MTGALLGSRRTWYSRDGQDPSIADAIATNDTRLRNETEDADLKSRMHFDTHTCEKMKKQTRT